MSVSLAERIVAWALAQHALRYAEKTHHNDGPPSVRFMGGREEPWCAHFHACAYRECGAPIPGDVVPNIHRGNPLASVSYTEGVYRDHDWLVASPIPGDTIFLKTRGASDTGPGRHIGIVVEVFARYVVSIEGNWGDCVARVTRSLDDPSISGYGRRPDPGAGV